MERVIFDTNAYRYLVTGKSFDEIDKYMEKVKSKEKQLDILPLISPIVVKELLAHVADKSDPSHQKCLNATKALYLHCGDDTSYHLLASPEMLIAKSFFNVDIPAKEETNKAMMQIAFHLGLYPSDHAERKFQRNLNLNRDHVLDAENFFAQSFLQWIKAVDPSATGWRVFPNDAAQRRRVLEDLRSERSSINLAAGLIYTVNDLLVKSGLAESMPETTLIDMSKQFTIIFPEYISLYKSVFENIINSEYNMYENSRSNFLWDIQLMLNVGNHTVNGEKLHFVTADSAIQSHAINNNAKYTIHTFNEYMTYIGMMALVDGK
ncbi:MAG: hypothetical protein BGO69_14675 [Bacteroidetes bacterium 46-16]|nr:MAG: hypothetical protein BGO69_14675 [Bacteroidetes bacterium 46-16]